MSDGIDPQWTASGGARSLRVLGPRASLFRESIAHWIDRARSTLWEAFESGHIQSTLLDEFVVSETSVAKGGEFVATAVFLPAKSPSVALVLQRPSSGLERVVLVRLLDGAIVELAKSRPVGFELYASLDGSRLLVAHSSSTVVCSFDEHGVAGPTFDAATPPFERDHWVLLDRDSWVSIDRQRVERGALGGATTVVREGDFGSVRALFGTAESQTLAYITRIGERGVLRATRSDASPLFEIATDLLDEPPFAIDREGATVVLVSEALARLDRTPGPSFSYAEHERWLGLWRGRLVARTPRLLLVRDIDALDGEPIARAEARAITSLALSRDGRRAITVEAGDRLRCYDTRDGTIVHELAIDGTCWLAGMCEGDRSVAVVRRDAVDTSVSLWRLADESAALSEVFSLDPSSDPRVLAVSSDGSRVALGSMVRDEVFVLSRRSNEPSRVEISRDRPLAARFVDEDRALVVRAPLAQRRWALDGAEVTLASQSEEKSAEEAMFVRVSATLAAVSEHEDTPSVSLSAQYGRSQWEDSAMLRRRIHALAVADAAPIAAVALSPSITIVVLDAHGTELARVERRQSTADRVTQMAFSEDGRRLVAATDGGQLVVVDLEL